MGTIKIKDADGAIQYIKTGGGNGTFGDPYAPEHTLPAGQTITIASGTAAIGVVDVGPQTAIAAGAAAAAALTGNTVQLATDTLRNGTTSVTPVFAVINVASTGSAQEIVAAAGASNKSCCFRKQYPVSGSRGEQ